MYSFDLLWKREQQYYEHISAFLFQFFRPFDGSLPAFLQ